MISIARTTNRNVTRWRDGQIVLRWTAAGTLNAEGSFRRIKGYKQMPDLVDALYRHAHPDTAQGAELSAPPPRIRSRPPRKHTRIGTRSDLHGGTCSLHGISNHAQQWSRVRLMDHNRRV